MCNASLFSCKSIDTTFVPNLMLQWKSFAIESEKKVEKKEKEKKGLEETWRKGIERST